LKKQRNLNQKILLLQEKQILEQQFKLEQQALEQQVQELLIIKKNLEKRDFFIFSIFFYSLKKFQFSRKMIIIKSTGCNPAILQKQWSDYVFEKLLDTFLCYGLMCCFQCNCIICT